MLRLLYSILLGAALPLGCLAGDGLLFSLSADHGSQAEYANGSADALFASGVQVTADGAHGPGLRLADDLTLAWPAAGNIQAQRGTLALFFRPRTPLSKAPLTVFRVSAADGSSWDMDWLRLDWNGQGFDGFVTDTNLARSRVSFTLEQTPAPDRWLHLALAWDEQRGVRLWVDGQPAARLQRQAIYDSGLFAFAPFQRIAAPWKVESANNYRRSGDLDEIRIYDRMLDDAAILDLSRHRHPSLPPLPPVSLHERAARANWWLRHGWSGAPPAYLEHAITRIRKVAFSDTRDHKQKMLRGADGIRETTWPGVYNRSRLPGRHDYFELPDWNVYSVGGQDYDLSLVDEPWNHIEIIGAAHGELLRSAGDGSGLLERRPPGLERTSTRLAEPRQGGALRFHNSQAEVPIQEIAAYHIAASELPHGLVSLDYRIDASADPDLYPALDELRDYITGRFVPAERGLAVALPAGAPRRPRPPQSTGLPLLHILIPADFRDRRAGQPPSRFSYGWRNMHAGLDGIVLELPAIAAHATHGDLLPLNIRIKDPNWPQRDLLDVNVSVKPGEARTLWLDTRDRLLPDDASLSLSIAVASAEFDAGALHGMRVRLIFKDAAEARIEHIADRLEQARDELAFLVEEHPNIRAYPVYQRFERDISDVLRVDPDNAVARAYWVEKNPEQPYAALPPDPVPAGIPAWAYRQSQALKQYRHFVDWWIDQRQIDNGELGGGLSDDSDLVNQWVGLALMGVAPQRLIDSQRKVMDATYANGMWSDGLSCIVTDALHSYEEGINTVAQAMQIDRGNPVAIERAMAVARNYPRLAQVNAAGHRHLVSAYFSGRQILRDGHHGWQQPNGLLITHPGLLLVDYNGSPLVRKLLLELLDGWLAHAGSDGGLPSEIEWASDQSRGQGVGSAVHLFWAAYRWSGDERYLRPILHSLRQGHLDELGQLNADLTAQMPAGAQMADQVITGTLQPGGRPADPNLGGMDSHEFAEFIRWQQDGDHSRLARLWARQVERTRQRMPLLTEAHFWSDRVAVPSELLQRTRLGGMALRRNAYYPGNLVSWRFAAPAQAEDVALLIPRGDPQHFRVIAYNLSEQSITATLIGAQLTAGRWRIRGAGHERLVNLEQGSGTELQLPPRKILNIDFSLIEAGEDPASRSDIGLSSADLRLHGRQLGIRIHSLGARPTPAGTALVERRDGQAVGQVRFAALEAPLDLYPRTAELQLELPAGTDTQGLRVRLLLDGNPSEVSRSNNLAILSSTAGQATGDAGETSGLPAMLHDCQPPWRPGCRLPGCAPGQAR